MILDPLNDGKSALQLKWVAGSDLEVVNDAKSSFKRESEFFGEKEEGLLKYLIRERHTSPLRGSVIKFKVKAPLALCRQWFKHTVASTHVDDQLGWNEQSFRYTEIEDPNEFYIPTVFRKQSSSNRQATEGALDETSNMEAIALAKSQVAYSYEVYRRMLALGVGREQARLFLDPAIYTTWVWTTSLQALLNFLDLRTGKGAQSEITLYAEAIEKLVEPYFPKTFEYWREFSN